MLLNINCRLCFNFCQDVPKHVPHLLNLFKKIEYDFKYLSFFFILYIRSIYLQNLLLSCFSV